MELGDPGLLSTQLLLPVPLALGRPLISLRESHQISPLSCCPWDMSLFHIRGLLTVAEAWLSLPAQVILPWRPSSVPCLFSLEHPEARYKLEPLCFFTGGLVDQSRNPQSPPRLLVPSLLPCLLVPVAPSCPHLHLLTSCLIGDLDIRKIIFVTLLRNK